MPYSIKRRVGNSYLLLWYNILTMANTPRMPNIHVSVSAAWLFGVVPFCGVNISNVFTTRNEKIYLKSCFYLTCENVYVYSSNIFLIFLTFTFTL